MDELVYITIPVSANRFAPDINSEQVTFGFEKTPYTLYIMKMLEEYKEKDLLENTIDFVTFSTLMQNATIVFSPIEYPYNYARLLIYNDELYEWINEHCDKKTWYQAKNIKFIKNRWHSDDLKVILIEKDSEEMLYINLKWSNSGFI